MAFDFPFFGWISPRLVLTWVLGLIFWISPACQTPSADSLQLEIAKAKDDTTRFSVINQLANEILKNNPDFNYLTTSASSLMPSFKLGIDLAICTKL